MEITTTLSNKSLKSREKIDLITEALLSNSVSIQEVMAVIQLTKDALKGICLEAITTVTQRYPDRISPADLPILSVCLSSKTPRVKWESARIIANCSKQFSAKQLETVLLGLLENADFEGTVVRWSAATAIGELIKHHPDLREHLLDLAKAKMENDPKNSIRKIYAAALRKC